MLTVDTKKHIDAARQVLVGKVPDPKQQIDQITNALIYKFMDDMDVQSRDAGGQPSFFTGDLEPYAWRKLMEVRRSSQERLNMYSEALEKFSTADQLPQLFRDIFRQAFLPYRDPETLNLFLKEIEYFDYSHSEELGNAFEYLLSIMGAQGDAGQFRTPRHIIDFIVDIITPSKDDTILDPACGTAGFLISAYKKIVKEHQGKDKKPLTHGEKQKLMNNLVGYDISSDMVKLARVNMYLHGNNQPKIYEYDSLTSEERWGDMFDVIMANPPFMSPKGGIRPHTKFGIESSRAEVLFVDYIMSHLKQNGRAGIIVPEGIIFQSGKAYKQLRKALVEDGLMAVISLPSGVFNPYAGVKTSILIFDNNRAKQSAHIVFAKVEHDGFDLGAQRRPTPGKDDLPLIASTLERYRLGLLKTQEEIDEYLADATAMSNISAFEFRKIPEIQLLERSKIAESGDYSLNLSRYASTEIKQYQKWPTIELGETFDMQNGRAFKTSEWSDEGLPIIRIANLNDRNAAFNYYNGEYDSKIVVREGDLLFSWSGTRGTSFGPHLWHSGVGLLNQHIFVLRPKRPINITYAFYMLKHIVPAIEDKAHGSGGLVHITKSELSNFAIPVPPLEVQQQIAEELNGYQNIVDGAQQVVRNYKPTLSLIGVSNSVPFRSVATLEYGYSLPKLSRIEGEYPVVGSNGIVGLHNDYKVKGPAIVVGRKGSAGEVVWVNDSCFPIDTTYYVRLNDDKDYSLKFIYYFLKQCNLPGLKGGAGVPGLNRNDVYDKIQIPKITRHEQELIAQALDREQEIINASAVLAKDFEQKIKARIAKVWSE